MRRGSTPRSAVATPRTAGGYRGLSLRRLEATLAAWIQARGLPPLTVRALSVTMDDTTAATEGASRSFVLTAEATIMLSGVEVLAKVSVANLSGPCADRASARAIEPKLQSAQTYCAWPAARQRLALAVQATSGKTIEEFLDALWAEGKPWGDGTLKGDSIADLGAVLSPYGTPAHLVKEEDDVIESSDESPLNSSCRSSCSSALRPTDLSSTTMGAPTDTGIAEEPVEEEASESEADAFLEWLNERPCIRRQEHAAAGKAWDYPQSKAEKREFLVLSLMAEEQQRQEALAAEAAAEEAHAECTARDSIATSDLSK